MLELRQLTARAGRYEGHGITDEEQPFYGELSIDVLFEHALSLHFRATGIDGTPYRDERGLVAIDEQGRLSLWSITAERMTCMKHILLRGAPPEGPEATIVFGRGDSLNPDDLGAEIALDLWSDGDISYRHSKLGGAHTVPLAAVRMIAAVPTIEREES